MARSKRVRNRDGRSEWRAPKSNAMISIKDDEWAEDAETGKVERRQDAFIKQIIEANPGFRHDDFDRWHLPNYEGGRAINFSKVLPTGDNAIRLPREADTLDQLLQKLKMVAIVIHHGMSVAVHASKIPPTMTVETVDELLPRVLAAQDNKALRNWVSNGLGRHVLGLYSTRDLNQVQLGALLVKCDSCVNENRAAPPAAVSRTQLVEMRMEVMSRILRTELAAGNISQKNQQQDANYRTQQDREEILTREDVYAATKKILAGYSKEVEPKKCYAVQCLRNHIHETIQELKLKALNDLRLELGTRMKVEKSDIKSRCREYKVPWHRRGAAKKSQDDLIGLGKGWKVKKRAADRRRRCFSVAPS